MGDYGDLLLHIKVVWDLIYSCSVRLEISLLCSFLGVLKSVFFLIYLLIFLD